MKSGAFFSIFLASGVFAAAAFVGCSSDDGGGETTPAEDSGADVVDSTPTDSAKPDTTPADTAPFVCDQPVGSDFECATPKPKAGSTACTDAAIDELLDACFGSSASSTKCSAWQKKYADCNKCALGTWIYANVDGSGFLDTSACMLKIKPDSTCAKAALCWFDCKDAVCGECEDTDRNKCEGRSRKSTEPKGSCYDVAYKEYKDCTADEAFAPCFDAVTFLRGACRDNADWSNAANPLPVDGGTDGATDATEDAMDAAEDAMDAAEDATPTDTASDDATSDSLASDASDDATDAASGD